MKDVGSRREHKKTELRQRIIQDAMTLFRQHGFAETSMESIAATAGITKRTLYKYFPVKEAIVSGFWMQNVQQQSQLLPQLLAQFPDTRSRLVAVFLSAAEGFMKEPAFARIHFSYQFQLLGKSANPQFGNDFDQFLTAVINTGQAEGDIRNDMADSELAAQLMFNFTAVCLIWFADTRAFSLEQRLKNTVDCFMDGAAKTKKTKRG